MKNHQPTTHEVYLHAVRDAVITRAQEKDTITTEQSERLAHTKLLYGSATCGNRAAIESGRATDQRLSFGGDHV